MFEKASRKKLRFESVRGVLSTEQLWEIPLEEVDTMAMVIVETLDAKSSGSFLKKTQNVGDDTLRMEILVHVIKTRVAEIEAKEASLANKTELDKLNKLIDEKEGDALRETSLSMLKKKRDALLNK